MSGAAADAVDVALLVGRALEAAGVRYFLGGSLASSMQGEPRSTNDIDLVIDMREAQVAALVSALGPDFSVDEEALCASLRQGIAANLFYLPLFIKVDLMPRGAAAFDESEFARRQSVAVGPDGAALWVKTAEDSVLRKLWWFEQGGRVSDRQWRDVVAILRASGARLDGGYLSAWSAPLGVAELLEAARREAESPGG